MQRIFVLFGARPLLHSYTTVAHWVVRGSRMQMPPLMQLAESCPYRPDPMLCTGTTYRPTGGSLLYLVTILIGLSECRWRGACRTRWTRVSVSWHSRQRSPGSSGWRSPTLIAIHSLPGERALRADCVTDPHLDRQPGSLNNVFIERRRPPQKHENVSIKGDANGTELRTGPVTTAYQN